MVNLTLLLIIFYFLFLLRRVINFLQLLIYTDACTHTVYLYGYQNQTKRGIVIISYYLWTYAFKKREQKRREKLFICLVGKLKLLIKYCMCARIYIDDIYISCSFNQTMKTKIFHTFFSPIFLSFKCILNTP